MAADWRQGPALLLLGWLSLIVMSTDARAADCNEPRYLRDTESDEISVPVNAAVFVHREDVVDLELAVRTIDGGTEAEGEWRTVVFVDTTLSPLLRFLPLRDLEPNRDYEVSVAGTPSGAEAHILLTFRTDATRVDDEDVAVPEVTHVETRSNGPLMAAMAGPMAEARVFHNSKAPVVLVARTEDVDMFDAVRGEGAVASAGAIERVDVSSTGCSGRAWPEGEAGGSDELVVGAIGHAGQFSGWSEPVTVTNSPITDTCASAGSSTTGTALLLVVVAWSIRSCRRGKVTTHRRRR